MACGENFTFGKDRAGNVEVLRTLCKEHGIDFYVQKTVTIDGAPVSDSRVRALLREGDLAGVYDQMFWRYAFTARAQKGRGVGKTLGFPTVNLPLPADFLLPNGVYAGLLIAGGRGYEAVINIGVHPTFEKAEKPLCEAHLLKMPEKEIRGGTVAFYKRLRDEIAFDSVEALKEQIARDCADARAYFEP